METIFHDKAIFDNEVIAIVQSNDLPPPTELVEKFKTAIKSSSPQIAIENGNLEPQEDGSPPTLQ